MGGNSSKSGKICSLQKKSVWKMAGTQPRTSCRSLFKQLEILPVLNRYILSLMNFIVNNPSVHTINARNKHHLHRPNSNLSCFQKSAFYTSIKVFNSLPPSVTILKNGKAKFKAAFRKYLLCRWFFMCKDDLQYFYKKCIVFYTVNLYMCIYDLFHV